MRITEQNPRGIWGRRPTGESTPYNYNAVANPDLRAHLIQSEEIIRGIPDWPVIPASFMRNYSEELGLKETYYVRLLLGHVLKRGIIDFTVQKAGHKSGTRYYFDKNQLRAFLALSWALRLWREHYRGTNITNMNVNVMVQDTKSALGSHPLAQEFHELQGVRGLKAITHNPTTPRNPTVIQPQKTHTTRAVSTPGGDRAGDRVEPTRTPTLQIGIPTISADESEFLRRWDRRRIQHVLNLLPEDSESISLDEFSSNRVDIPPYVIRVAMFINAVNSVALGRRRNLDGASFKKVKNDLNICLEYLQKYEKKIANLNELFSAIKRKVEETALLG